LSRLVGLGFKPKGFWGKAGSKKPKGPQRCPSGWEGACEAADLISLLEVLTE